MVDLPELKRVHLLGDVDDCSALLSVLSIPCTASLKISSQRLWGGVDARDILIRIRKHFRAEAAPVMRSFQIE